MTGLGASALLFRAKVNLLNKEILSCLVSHQLPRNRNDNLCYNNFAVKANDIRIIPICRQILIKEFRFSLLNINTKAIPPSAAQHNPNGIELERSERNQRNRE